MKVYIGNYPDRMISRLYDKWMDFKYGEDTTILGEYKEDTFDKWVEKVDEFLQWIYNHTINLYLDKQTQKIKVRIDYHDVWAMDNTLPNIIVPMLKKLKEIKNGAPYVDNSDTPEHLHSTKDPNYNPDTPEDVDEFFFKRWDYVMDEMIWAFEQKLGDEDWEEQYYDWEIDEKDPFGIKLKNVDNKGREKHHKRMENGFRLFGKYYENLWD